MLVAEVRQALVRHRMVAPGARMVVGCSGGPDSTALLAALARLGRDLRFEPIAAAIDHGLRASAADELALVGEVAARLGLEHLRAVVDVPAAVRGSRRTDRSVHGVARRLRYAALFELARSRGATRIAVAHTMDDQAETVLLRLLRGASLGGLAAMRPVRGDGLIRPLLGVRRAAVLAFLEAEGLPFARDPSNDDPRYLRARLRTRVIPALLAEDPRLVEHLAALASEVASVDALRRAAARPLAAAALEGHGPAPVSRIEVASVSDAPEAIRPVVAGALLERITGRPARRRWVDALLALCGPERAGELPLPGALLRRRPGAAELEVEAGPPRVRSGRRDREGV